MRDYLADFICPSVLPINSHFNVDEPFSHLLGFRLDLFGHGIDQLSRSPNVTPHLDPPHLAFM